MDFIRGYVCPLKAIKNIHITDTLVNYSFTHVGMSTMAHFGEPLLIPTLHRPLIVEFKQFAKIQSKILDVSYQKWACLKRFRKILSSMRTTTGSCKMMFLLWGEEKFATQKESWRWEASSAASLNSKCKNMWLFTIFIAG